jgi:hypothetical protein
MENNSQLQYDHDITFIRIILSLIDELYVSRIPGNLTLANKYIDLLQQYGYKLRLIDGHVVLIDYQTHNIPLSKL